jgi:hypothetical protein
MDATTTYPPLGGHTSEWVGWDERRRSGRLAASHTADTDGPAMRVLVVPGNPGESSRSGVHATQQTYLLARSVLPNSPRLAESTCRTKLAGCVQRSVVGWRRRRYYRPYVRQLPSPVGYPSW